MSGQIYRALEAYAEALEKIEQSAPDATSEQVIAVLGARDAIHEILGKSEIVQKGACSLVTITELDERMQKQARLIAQTVKLADYRKSLNPPSEAWWWFFDKEHPQGWWDRFDWLWSALTILCLTIALSLVVDISSRFLSDGPDTLGVFAVVFQSMLTLLAAGGTLTDAGQQATDHILKSLNIKERYWHELKSVFALALLIAFIVFRLSLPNVARWYNNQGAEDHQAGQLWSAQANYNRAIKLNPDYVQAHYNLGALYEELLDFEQAQMEYQIAAKGGLDAAYNNLARLYILSEDYDAASSLLFRNLGLAEDKDVEYDMLKNLGWARLGQERYAEAEVHLEEAIKLKSKRAPAYCLLAEVLEAQGEVEGALPLWETCLKYIDLTDSDEDRWYGMARERLNPDGG